MDINEPMDKATLTVILNKIIAELQEIKNELKKQNEDVNA